jgi:alcohol dehydrogenase
VVDAAGNVRALQTAVELTAPGGPTITVGPPPPDARLRLSPLSLVGQGRSVIGSYLGSAVPPRDMPAFIAL